MSDEFNKISQEYRLLVEKAAKNNEDFYIANSTLDHAKLLSYTLINKAKKEIKIFTGSLLELFYDNQIILKALEKKLGEGVKVKIITERKPEATECLTLMKKHKNLQIWQLKEKAIVENHFLVADALAFRVEQPHSAKDTKKKNFNVYGKANFNNKHIGSHINDVFDDLLKTAVSVN